MNVANKPNTNTNRTSETIDKSELPPLSLVPNNVTPHHLRSHPYTNIYKKNLKILSWNIRSRNTTLEGNTFNIPEFRSVLEQHDIICLQETKAVINLENYRCFNSNRKLKNSDKINSKAGGVAILVRKEIEKGITRITSKSTPDAIIIKLSKHYFRQTNDIYIISAYISPSNLPYRKSQQSDPWELLQEIVSSTTSKGELILCGDFNAWTNNNPDFITSHDIPFIDLPPIS